MKKNLLDTVCTDMIAMQIKTMPMIPTWAWTGTQTTTFGFPPYGVDFSKQTPSYSVIHKIPR